MSWGKKRRVTDEGDISMGGGNFGVSIGNVLGVTKEPGEIKSRAGRKKEPGAEANRHVSAEPESALAPVSQVILRRESSGRGGRAVTIADFRPSPDEKTADELAKMMRRGLGCGSHVEDKKIVLQGDMRERASAWLTKQGVKKIVMCN
jgi:translation initiation factor 1 (eIF-1/SUI1)